MKAARPHTLRHMSVAKAEYSLLASTRLSRSWLDLASIEMLVPLAAATQSTKPLGK